MLYTQISSTYLFLSVWHNFTCMFINFWVFVDLNRLQSERMAPFNKLVLLGCGFTTCAEHSTFFFIILKPCSVFSPNFSEASGLSVFFIIFFLDFFGGGSTPLRYFHILNLITGRKSKYCKNLPHYRIPERNWIKSDRYLFSVWTIININKFTNMLLKQIYFILTENIWSSVGRLFWDFRSSWSMLGWLWRSDDHYFRTLLCDKVCQWLAADRWLSPGSTVSSTN